MRMVVVRTVGTRFEAELLAAKLGAHGVLWEIRSRQLVPTTHPIGFLDVMVPADEVDDAEAVLAPDELPVLRDDGTTIPPEELAELARRRRELGPGLRTLRVLLGLGLGLALVAFLADWVGDLLRFLGLR
jgi:hypothetical protein